MRQAYLDSRRVKLDHINDQSCSTTQLPSHARMWVGGWVMVAKRDKKRSGEEKREKQKEIHQPGQKGGKRKTITTNMPPAIHKLFTHLSFSLMGLASMVSRGMNVQGSPCYKRQTHPTQKTQTRHMTKVLRASNSHMTRALCN